VVGLSSFKGWQEAVVDVDGMVCMPCTEILTEDLHVPEQQDQLCSLCWLQHCIVMIKHHKQERCFCSGHESTHQLVNDLGMPFLQVQLAKQHSQNSCACESLKVVNIPSK